MLKREDFTPERVDALIAEARKHGPYDALTHEEREASRQAFLADRTGDGLWVFGYGSLLWNPAFHFEHSEPARLFGYRRNFCLKLPMGRGSPEFPGIMLALDLGGSCNGRAFYIKPEQVDSETRVLWLREMLSGAYRAAHCHMRLADKTVSGLTFIVNRRHSRYMNDLSLKDKVHLIATGSGHLGTCRDYLDNTVAHLDEINVRDRYLHHLKNMIDRDYPIPQKK